MRYSTGERVTGYEALEEITFTMQALVFRYSMPRFAFARLLGMITPRAYLSFGGPTRLEEIPQPELLGDDWTIVRTTRCGICGSDVKQVFLDANFDNPLTALITPRIVKATTAPFASQPRELV